MKKQAILLITMLVAVVAMKAQTRSSDYFVFTKDAKQTAVPVKAEGGDGAAVEKVRDVMKERFPFRRLCDWREGMRFMVRPDKRDYVMRSFADAADHKKVSITSLRNKILVYTGHDKERPAHLFFRCEDDGRNYYFEVPYGDFDDYCSNKLGVSSLASLSDVDSARVWLLGKTLVTKLDTYYKDVDYSESGAEEVSGLRNKEVKVVKVGIGTRSYPVKLVVADSLGNEFFQTVAISRTNSGLRDDEFSLMDHRGHLMTDAFEMLGDETLPSWTFDSYKNKMVYTRQGMWMEKGREGKVHVGSMAAFTISAITSVRGTRYAKLTLTSAKERRTYTKNVYFRNFVDVDTVADAQQKVFDLLFNEGAPANMKDVNPKHLDDINQGVVKIGFTETEVMLARPDKHEVKAGRRGSGTYEWIYNEVNTTHLRVVFSSKTHKVKEVR